MKKMLLIWVSLVMLVLAGGDLDEPLSSVEPISVPEAQALELLGSKSSSEYDLLKNIDFNATKVDSEVYIGIGSTELANSTFLDTAILGYKFNPDYAIEFRGMYSEDAKDLAGYFRVNRGHYYAFAGYGKTYYRDDPIHRNEAEGSDRYGVGAEIRLTKNVTLMSDVIYLRVRDEPSFTTSLIWSFK